MIRGSTVLVTRTLRNACEARGSRASGGVRSKLVLFESEARTSSHLFSSLESRDRQQSAECSLKGVFSGVLSQQSAESISDHFSSFLYSYN